MCSTGLRGSYAGLSGIGWNIQFWEVRNGKVGSDFGYG